MKRLLSNIKKRILFVATSVLLTSICIPTYPTVVRIGLWRNPETGFKIVGIGDLHLPSQCEAAHKDVLLDHIAAKESAHLAVEDIAAMSGLREGLEDRFLPGLVAQASKKNVDAASLEFRYGTCAASECPIRTAILLKKCEEIQSTIPDLFQKEFNTLVEQMYVVDAKAKAIAQADGTPSASIDELFSFYKAVDPLEMRVFNYASLSHAMKQSSLGKSLYICMGNDHIEFLASCLKQLGYEELENFVTNTKTDTLWDHFMKHQNIDAYAIDMQDILKKIDC